MGQLHDVAECLDYLIGVAGTYRDQSGNGAQRGKMLDWLMGRAIFSDSDRIMGENVNHRDFHQGAKTNRRPAVIAEDQEP